MVSHSFIACRDDRTADSQAITFAGNSWRDYIPIARSRTVCVREHLPPGSVAVLINREHPFTDLILAVDAIEDRLLGAIDGTQTLSEIGQFAMQNDDGERRALSFFERLWLYDQVVFDASHAAANPRDDKAFRTRKAERVAPGPDKLIPREIPWMNGS